MKWFCGGVERRYRHDLGELLNQTRSPRALKFGLLGHPWILFGFDSVVSFEEETPEKARIWLGKREKELTSWGGVFLLSYDFLAWNMGLNFSRAIPPQACFAVPDVVVFPQGEEVVALGKTKEALERFFAVEEDSPTQCEALQIYPDFPTYEQWFSRAHKAVLDGETYQIKISVKAQGKGHLNAADFFLKLSDLNPSPERFLWESPNLKLVGSSPESFLQIDKDRVLTRPIGGTLRKPGWQTGKPEIRSLPEVREEFLRNKKEVSEHSMLVDLERNDLSSFCEPGSVRIIRLMEVEEYSHLYHIVTTIEGRKKAGVSLAEALEKMAPGGTISGCPRYRTMEWIEKIEATPRGFYTGVMGFMGPDYLNTNLILRTVMEQDGQIEVQAGGGIVADSTAEYEYEENLSKAQALVELLES